MVEYCEIYISGVRREGLGWVSNSDEFLDEIAENLSDIERFTYISLSLNMAQVYNFHLKTSSYDSMLLYLKGVRYKGFSLLSTNMVHELQDKLRLYLSYVYGLTFENIEIKSVKKYEYTELENE